MMTLGPEQSLWLQLEAALNDLKNKREEAYFDLGFEHGFGAGRSDASSGAPRVRELASRLRDLAIQHGSVDEALAAVLEAAQALATRPVPPASIKRTERAAHVSSMIPASDPRRTPSSALAHRRRQPIRDADSRRSMKGPDIL